MTACRSIGQGWLTGRSVWGGISSDRWKETHPCRHRWAKACRALGPVTVGGDAQKRRARMWLGSAKRKLGGRIEVPIGLPTELVSVRWDGGGVVLGGVE